MPANAGAPPPAKTSARPSPVRTDGRKPQPFMSGAVTPARQHVPPKEGTEDHLLEQLTIASGYIDLGHACRNEHEYDSAIAFFYKALATYRALPDSQRTMLIKVANVYTNLGVVYGLRKLHDKEMDFFNKALQLYMEQHGMEHVNVAMAYNNLGIASRNTGNRADSMTYFKKSLGIYRGLYGEQHPECVRTRRNIERLRSVWKQ